MAGLLLENYPLPMILALSENILVSWKQCSANEV